MRALGRALIGGGKLVVLRRAARTDFAASPELFAALVAIDIALLFVLSIVAFGVRGEVNWYELPRAFLFVPLALAAGLFARRADRGSPLLLLPVALAAVSVLMTAITWVLYVLARHRLLPFLETYWYRFDDVVLVWSAAIVGAAALRLIGGTRAARAATALAAVVLIVVPAWWLPQGMVWMPRDYASGREAAPSFHTLAEEKAFYAQHAALERELERLEPERAGVTDLYVLAAGLYAGEDVFMKDVRLVTSLLAERFDTAGRTVTLVNNTKTLETHPIASLTSIRQALQHLAGVMNVEEDVLVLYVTSHGSEKHELSVDFRPLKFEPIDPARLRAALDASGIRWRVIVVSACYSGGFIEALRDERTLVVTAAAADRASFGCGQASESTYLARALFGDALRHTRSLEAAFAQARTSIERWEREQGYAPSHPQLEAGAKMRAKWSEIERRLERKDARGR